MPELPEVETTRRGIAPHIEQQTITRVIVRQTQLRWPVPTDLTRKLSQQMLQRVVRRGKYLILSSTQGHMIIHLGMSGRLYLIEPTQIAQKHDHIDIIFAHGKALRFTDPRRFGCLLWTQEDPYQHTLLKDLGPEPLTDDFNGNYLYQQARNRTVDVKQFIMNSHVVVGVGNIYANEALFKAGIHPQRSAKHISLERYEYLASAIKHILSAAIQQGGTTLRDFISGDGKPGYFQQHLSVYSRGDQACLNCTTTLREIRINQRSTVYCPQCQR
ncbi:MAG: bifunctional DNA-formamidopyrimidine glycosylase/DNA-(apurinic or apyrimidinic site) lyase [Gammaproteobacteria bacterium]